MLQKTRRKDCKKQRIREFTVRLCFLIMSEATLMKSLQHDSLNTSLIRITPVDMESGWGKFQEAATLQKYLEAAEENWGWER